MSGTPAARLRSLGGRGWEPHRSREHRLRNVLFVTGLDAGRKFGSMEEEVLVLATALRERGAVFVPVFSHPPTGGYAAAYEGSGLPYAVCDLLRSRFSTARYLGRLIRKHRVEVVNWSFYQALCAQFLILRQWFPRVRHIFTHHDSRPEPYVQRRSAPKRLAKKALLAQYERVLAVSEFVRDCLVREGWWPRVGRFWHFVNTDRFAPSEANRARVRRAEGVDDEFVVVAVAQLIRDKGLHVLLHALSQPASTQRAWIIGEGVERERLEAEARTLGLADRVRFLGGQRNVEPFLQAADAAVCPSIWGEAAGLVNLEAAAAGIPMVASRVGGIPEFVRDGETGVLVPPGDAPALAHALRSLQDQPERRRQLGAQARRHAERSFSIQANLGRNLAAYQFGAPT